MDADTVTDITMKIVCAAAKVVAVEFDTALGLEAGVLIIAWPTEEEIAPEAERIAAQGLACTVNDRLTIIKVLKRALAKLEKRQ